MSIAAPLPLLSGLLAPWSAGGLPVVIAVAVRATAERARRRAAEDHMSATQDDATEAPRGAEQALFAGRHSFACGETGVSFDTLLVPYLRGARRIVITDKYMHMPYQIRNLRDLLAAVAASGIDGTLDVELVTTESESTDRWKHYHRLSEIQDFARSLGIHFTVVFRDPSEMHPRFIEADTGWVIDLDRGLDIFQPGPLGLRQDLRKVRTFVINYTRVGS